MGEPRFAMLETIREYALEQLTASQDRDSAERRHAAWYLDLAERAETHLLSAEQRTWLERLEREHENLRSALAWSLRTPGAIDAGLTAAGALLPFWWIRGHLSEAREWLRRALAVPEAAPRARGRALLAAGRLAILQGQEDVALGALEESEALARQQDDVFTTARTVAGLAELAADDPERARDLGRASLRLFHEAGNRWGEGSPWRASACAQPDGDTRRTPSRCWSSPWRDFAKSTSGGGSRSCCSISLPRSHPSNATSTGGGRRCSRAWRSCRSSVTARASRGRWTPSQALAQISDGGSARSGWPAPQSRSGKASERPSRGPAPQRVQAPNGEDALGAARRALGKQLFEREWAAGRAMSLPDAVSYGSETSGANASGPAAPTTPAETPRFRLTTRELEVLGLLAAGHSNAEIARILVLSVKTVERHIANLYAKIGAHCRVDATAYAFRQGLL